MLTSYKALDQAERYSRLKYSLALGDIAYLFLIILLFQASGWSKSLSQGVFRLTSNYYLGFGLYLLAVYGVYFFLDIPVSFYRSFIVEHKFGLSNQTVGDWLKDQLKTGAISYVVLVILFEAFYYILRSYPAAWWLIVSIFWIFFSIVMAKLVPVVLIPLFFKYKPLTDSALKERIVNLAHKLNVKILDVFEIDFSKKTLKANAAFAGWGKSRRVILADTLKDKYTIDEIEVILAHEFAHCKLNHIFKLIAVNSCVTLFSFYLIFKTSSSVLGAFGLSSLSDIAGFPVVLIYLGILGVVVQPLDNFISRKLEKNADLMALKTTGLREAFISAMNKLAQQNLADKKPHPIIKFFFFDHPAIEERIALANAADAR